MTPPGSSRDTEPVGSRQPRRDVCAGLCSRPLRGRVEQCTERHLHAVSCNQMVDVWDELHPYGRASDSTLVYNHRLIT